MLLPCLLSLWPSIGERMNSSDNLTKIRIGAILLLFVAILFTGVYLFGSSSSPKTWGWMAFALGSLSICMIGYFIFQGRKGCDNLSKDQCGGTKGCYVDGSGKCTADYGSLVFSGAPRR